MHVSWRRIFINLLALSVMSFVVVSVALAQACTTDEILDASIALALEECDETRGNTVCLANDDVYMQMDSGRDVYIGDTVSVFDVREIIASPADTDDSSRVRWGVAIVVIEPAGGGRVVYVPYGGIRSTTDIAEDGTMGYTVRRSVDDGDCQYLEQGVLIETPTEDRIAHEIVINNVRIVLASRALIVMNSNNTEMRIIGMDGLVKLTDLLTERDIELNPGEYADVGIATDGTPTFIEEGILTKSERDALVYHPQLLSSIVANRDYEPPPQRTLTDTLDTPTETTRRIVEAGIWYGEDPDVQELHMPGNVDAWVLEIGSTSDVRVLVACPGSLDSDDDCVIGGLDDPEATLYDQTNSEIVISDDLELNAVTEERPAIENETGVVESEVVEAPESEQYLLAIRGNGTFTGRYMICIEVDDITCPPIPRVEPINEDPEIVLSNDIWILNNGSAQYVIDARDPDGDALTYTVSVANPLIASVTPSGGGRFVISGQAVGSTGARMVVSDGNGGVDSANFTIFINPSCPTPTRSAGDVVYSYYNQPLYAGAGSSSVVLYMDDDDFITILSNAVCVGTTNWYQAEVSGTVGWVTF